MERLISAPGLGPRIRGTVVGRRPVPRFGLWGLGFNRNEGPSVHYWTRRWRFSDRQSPAGVGSVSESLPIIGILWIRPAFWHRILRSRISVTGKRQFSGPNHTIFFLGGFGRFSRPGFSDGTRNQRCWSRGSSPMGNFVCPTQFCRRKSPKNGPESLIFDDFGPFLTRSNAFGPKRRIFSGKCVHLDLPFTIFGTERPDLGDLAKTGGRDCHEADP